MFRKRIEKLKINQFSDNFLIWVSTLLFLPLAIFFRFINGTWLVLDRHYLFYTRSVWILGFVFTIWLIWKWLFDDRFLTTGVEIYLGAFYLVMWISSIFSENPSLSIEKLIGISAYILGIYILIDLKRSANLWQGMINALLLTAGISSLLSLIRVFYWLDLYQVTLVQIIIDPVYVLNILPRLPDLANFHHSVTAGYLVLIIPLGLYQFLQTKNFFCRLVLGFSTFLHLAVLMLTKSRGGFLGLLIMLFALTLLYRKSLLNWLFKSKFRIILAALLGSLFAAGGIFMLAKTRGFSFVGRNMLVRYQGWFTVIKIIQEHPWLGSGLGTFGMKFLEYRNPIIFSGSLIHAHNQLLQISAELGLLGLIAFSLIFWRFFRNLGQRQQADLPDSSRLALAALAGLFGVLIPDAIFTSSMIVLLFIFYLVWLLPPGNNYPLQQKSRIYTFLSLAVILVGLGAGWTIWKLQPYQTALEAALVENWPEANKELKIAQERDPNNPYYQTALGFAAGQAACQSGGGYDESIAYYEESFRTYQGWGIDHANTAVLYGSQGDYQNAASQLELANQYQPNVPVYYCLLGDYHLQLGKQTKALKAYGKCIAENATYLDTPYWQENNSRQNLTPSVVIEAENYLENLDPDLRQKRLAQLYLSTGELEKASQIILDFIQINPQDIRGKQIYIEVLIASGDHQLAEEVLEQLLLDDPRNPSLWLSKGKIALENGQDQIAEYAFNVSYRVRALPETAWLFGQYLASRGDLESALKLYQQALFEGEPVTKFSRDVAARWPLPGIYLDCMPEIKTYAQYFTPGLEAAQSLEDQNCFQAACIYQGLLLKNPAPAEAHLRLEGLACYQEFDPDLCFFENPE